MNSKSWLCQLRTSRKISGAKTKLLRLAGLALLVALCPRPAAAGSSAPGWMHALTGVALPAHDDKTNAVLLYSDTTLTVQPNGKIKKLERKAFKILRPDGREYGTVAVYFDAETRITSIHGWSIPEHGDDYEVKDKDGVEGSLGIENGDLVSDLKRKILLIPAADPGNIVGYEVEQELRPYVLQDEWFVQSTVPTREAHYTLQVPSGWEYKATWLHQPESAPTPAGEGAWRWTVGDMKAVKPQDDMPPFRGVAGRMIISLLPPGEGPNKGFVNWGEVGSWYGNLVAGRGVASPEIKQKVAALTSSAPTQLAKMQAIAHFLQSDIRYVAIELGVGGMQPHPALETFTKHFGDCKDKVTLMSAMLKEIGMESYYVLVNTERGVVNESSPPYPEFNHAILAIQMPAQMKDPSLIAVMQHPKLGRILFFDPTDEMTPLGMIAGRLQANYAMLVAPDASGLVEIPKLMPDLNSIERKAKLTLDPGGRLQGEMEEVRRGDPAESSRWALRSATRDVDQIKPIETVLSRSLSTYRITRASVGNLHQTELPLQYSYAFVADGYAKAAGNLLLVRPRVVGTKANDVMEAKEAREYPVEFEGPERDTDEFEIALPAGYSVDDLPPPVSVDFGFAAYQSKSEVHDNVLRYSRTFEVKDVDVPLAKVEELKKFYRIIAGDERNAAVLVPATH